MKVCFITPTTDIGGYESFLLNIIKSFKGYDLYTIAVNAVGGFRDEFSNDTVLVDLKCNRARKSVFKMAKKLKYIQPDIVYVSFYELIIPIVIIKIILNLKYKIVIGEHIFFNCNNKIKKIIIRNAYRYADEIVAVSKSTKEHLCKQLNLDKNKVKVIYNPVINDNTEKLYNEEFCFKKYKDKVTIGTLGRIEKNKGYQDLLYAFKNVENKDDKQIIIIGEGRYKKELQILCKELNIEKYVDFIGFTKNPYKILRKIDYLAVLSEKETFCNVIVEALYCYCNIIAYDEIGGPNEILDNGKYGKLIKYKDINQLTEELNYIKKKNFDVNLRSRANDFSHKLIINQYKDIFINLLN